MPHSNSYLYVYCCCCYHRRRYLLAVVRLSCSFSYFCFFVHITFKVIYTYVRSSRSLFLNVYRCIYSAITSSPNGPFCFLLPACMCICNRSGRRSYRAALKVRWIMIRTELQFKAIMTDKKIFFWPFLHCCCRCCLSQPRVKWILDYFFSLKELSPLNSFVYWIRKRKKRLDELGS